MSDAPQKTSAKTTAEQPKTAPETATKPTPKPVEVEITSYLKTSHKAYKDYAERLKPPAEDSTNTQNSDKDTPSSKTDVGKKAETKTESGKVEDKQAALQQLLVEASEKRGWQFLPNGSTHAFQNDYGLECGRWQVVTNGDKPKPEGNHLVLQEENLILYKDGEEAQRATLEDGEALVTVLNHFYNNAPKHVLTLEKSIADHQKKFASVTAELQKKLADLREENSSYKRAFDSFYAICREAIDNRLHEDAVDAMLVQHLFIVPLIKAVLSKDDLIKTNYIASAVDKVWSAVPDDIVDRAQINKYLAFFYQDVGRVAEKLDDWSAQQDFLFMMYDRVIRDKKSVDEHVTPVPMVDLMWQGVAAILDEHLKLKWKDKAVKVLDVSTGTGEFITTLLKRLSKSEVPAVYKEQIFANEMSLLHFYLAKLNIEHTYGELADKSAPFNNISFADTLDLKKQIQMSMMLFREENDERLDRQRETNFTVIIGNTQLHQDKHPARRSRYKALKRDPQTSIDDHIAEHYAAKGQDKDTKAIYDHAARFIRWATERLNGEKGIICLVGSHDLVASREWDGVRASLHEDFDLVYHLGLDEGQAITILAKVEGDKPLKFHHKMPTEKLAENPQWKDIEWNRLYTNPRHGWHVLMPMTDYQAFVPIDELFVKHTRGVSTRRDPVVYAFQKFTLNRRVKKFIEDYNAEVKRAEEHKVKQLPDAFEPDEKLLWSKGLKAHLKAGKTIEFDAEKIRASLYRPYGPRYLYFDTVLNEEVADIPTVLPKGDEDNRLICLASTKQIGLGVLMTKVIPDANLFAAPAQCFPFYTYDKNGKPVENISDETLRRFHEHYYDDGITKWDIFYYIYGVLHHPTYLKENEDSLQQALPRVPLAAWFYDISDIGRQLADWHINPQDAELFELTEKITPDKKADYKVSKMRLNKEKNTIRLNSTVSLEGVPAEAFDYQVGRRSAVEWVIDQYREQKDTRSGITSKPNDPDNEKAIVEILQKVIRISVDSAKLLKEFPPLFDE